MSDTRSTLIFGNFPVDDDVIFSTLPEVEVLNWSGCVQNLNLEDSVSIAGSVLNNELIATRVVTVSVFDCQRSFVVLVCDDSAVLAVSQRLLINHRPCYIWCWASSVSSIHGESSSLLDNKLLHHIIGDTNSGLFNLVNSLNRISELKELSSSDTVDSCYTEFEDSISFESVYGVFV